jgi:hypothetical protein
VRIDGPLLEWQIGEMSLSTLCQSCGLCCDGSLFAFVSVEPDEGPALLARDIALELRKDGSYRMRQICTGLQGTRCSVYEIRPRACRSYTCLLGTALEQGEVSLDDALGLVGEARGRIAHLDGLLPLPANAHASPVQRVRQSKMGEGPSLPTGAVEAWNRVRDFLQRHFTGRHGLR